MRAVIDKISAAALSYKVHIVFEFPVSEQKKSARISFVCICLLLFFDLDWAYIPFLRATVGPLPNQYILLWRWRCASMNRLPQMRWILSQGACTCSELKCCRVTEPKRGNMWGKLRSLLKDRRNKEDQGIEMQRIRSGSEANRDEKSEELIKINLIYVNKRKRR